MAFFKEELGNVKAFVFDVDGVLSSDVSPINELGEPMRTTNVKDGFAIRNAILNGYPVAIISGGRNETTRLRYHKIGVEHIYLNRLDKVECLSDFLQKTGLQPEEILYMGDDLPDFEVMKIVGIPTCPADAVAEIKSISKYISDCVGGYGCVRDVIEQVMRAHGKWTSVNAFNTSAF